MQIQNHACINYDKIKLTSKIYSKTSNHAVLELIVLEQLSLNLLFSCPCKKNRRKLTEIIRNVLDCMVLEMSTLCCCLYTCILLLFVFFCSPHMYIIALKQVFFYEGIVIIIECFRVYDLASEKYTIFRIECFDLNIL